MLLMVLSWVLDSTLYTFYKCLVTNREMVSEIIILVRNWYRAPKRTSYLFMNTSLSMSSNQLLILHINTTFALQNRSIQELLTVHSHIFGLKSIHVTIGTPLFVQLPLFYTCLTKQLITCSTLFGFVQYQQTYAALKIFMHYS